MNRVQRRLANLIKAKRWHKLHQTHVSVRVRTIVIRHNLSLTVQHNLLATATYQPAASISDRNRLKSNKNAAAAAAAENLATYVT